MGYIEYLQKAIDYIEENITSEITIDGCASTAGFSKYHFYRIFSLYMNTSLMDYVRKRKLSYAMAEVSAGKRILDIAMDYGYGSERAFRRAFLQEYCRNPSICRGLKYFIPPKPVLEELLVKNGGNSCMENVFSDVRFETLDTLYVVSLVVKSRTPEDDVIEKLTQWAKRNGLNEGARKFGFDYPVSDEEQRRGIRGYEYWICADKDTPVSEGVALKRIEGCKYAVLTIKDPFSDPFSRIPQGWKRLMEWVNGQGYAPLCDKERYWLEEVIEKGGETSMDIYFPVS